MKKVLFFALFFVPGLSFAGFADKFEIAQQENLEAKELGIDDNHLDSILKYLDEYIDTIKEQLKLDHEKIEAINLLHSSLDLLRRGKSITPITLFQLKAWAGNMKNAYVKCGLDFEPILENRSILHNSDFITPMGSLE